jgi:hypothetical protein
LCIVFVYPVSCNFLLQRTGHFFYCFIVDFQLLLLTLW